MAAPLPPARDLPGLLTVDLDDAGNFLDPGTRRPVPEAALEDWLARTLRVPAGTTDVFVFVHGWRATREGAREDAARLFTGLEAVRAGTPGRYPRLGEFRGFFVAVRWPSMSSPLPWGYRRIRDRAHAMTTGGRAEFVLAQLLGYLHRADRRATEPGRRAVTLGGQHLHAVGHSFGGRFLAEAIQVAATPRSLDQARQFPFTVDSLLVFQMGARPDAFGTEFAALLDSAPLAGPTVLTHSRFDRANCLWHRFVEGGPAIGCVGATEPRNVLSNGRLKDAGETYGDADLAAPIVNLDASWLYRRGRWRLEGAHSDIFYDASAHLLLSLADQARERARPAG